MIDFFVPPPHTSVAARQRWQPTLKTYPDDYHFCTPEQVRTEIVTLTNRAKARGLYAEYGMIMSQNSPLTEIKLYIDTLCNTDTNVHITGESGTGKDLIARCCIYGEDERRDHSSP